MRRREMLSHSSPGSGHDRVAESRRHLVVCVDLGLAARTEGDMLSDQGRFVVLHRIEGERGEQIAGLLMGHHASTP